MNSQMKMIVKDAIILLTVSTVFVTIVNQSFKKLKKAEIQDPVITAVMQEDTKQISELLRDNGTTKLNFQDSFGRTALMWASYANLESEKLLKEAEVKRLEMIKTFIGLGANPNVVDNDGWNALMWASWSGMNEVTRVLLESGSDLKLTDKNGNTALILATMRGNKEIVKMLLEKGADKTTTTTNGKNVVDVAKEMLVKYPSKKIVFEEILGILG